LVQDLIFRSLSKNETNLYMVGDVKQSIYGFRLADPSIFVSKYELSHVTKLVLSKNFRSRPEVLDSINLVFEKIMTKALGGIDYTEREALYPGVNYPESDTPESELCMIEKRDGVSCQAEYAAKRIMEMLHDESFTVFDKKLGEKRRARPSDFAILLRSASNMALYKDALSRVGIRSYYETRERLLNTDEVSTVLALLEIIDNPHSDIQLASVMRSPIFGLTLTELTEISKNGDGDYYTRIKKTAEGEGKTAEKAKMFLNIIEDLRIISFDTTVDKLLRHIYYKLGVLRLYSSMGKDRKLNLIAFLDMARAFESKGYRGLYAFVNMAKRMLEVDSSPPTPVDPATDGVSIMTVHKSKGLEFPVVLYGELDHKFNLDDTSRDVLIHRDLGAGFKRRQNERRIEYPTLHRLAIKLTLEREMRSEEERIMYVAMTRAREKLIVICDYVESILEKAKSFAAFDEIPSAALLGAYRPLEWLAAATADKVKAKERGWKTIYVEEVTLEDDENIPESRPAADTDEEKIARIREQLGYQYEHLVATSVPSKLTATSLKGRYLDMEAVSGTPGKITYSKTPSFLSEEQQMSGSEKGIALHLAMQFIDFKKCLSLEGIASEINRLREKRILTEKQAESVEPEKIHRFFISPLGKQLMSSPEFYREFKFSILCDVSINEEGAEAVKNTPQGDSVLLQGVIDCYFVLPDDTLSLLDFKTDNVTGTFVEKRAKEYGEQIKSYAYALERITGKRVSEKYLYFFNADRAVKV
ncbi:MAG: UvrD-helicase domain-containing protein, partial [Clostridiales bacterium]|nr:UvrD-helicase domain-containing protein [Clostridiales bacterium]